jgi:MerR family transcriptional regulator/heat shock protein HspR
LVFYRRINETSNINQSFEERPIVEGVYVISVAARILDTHPQTLRKYERLGLVSPSRSMGMLRLYSAEDVLRVKLIKHMVDTLGLNLAGVEFALALLNRVINLKERLNDISRDENTNELLSKKLNVIIAEMDKILPVTI